VEIREYGVWSIEYRESQKYGWRVAALGGRWREGVALKGRPETGRRLGICIG